MINVKSLSQYIDHELNVLISGPAGTGKTTSLLEACKNLGIKMKYFSASTLDPYIDLVGVPDIQEGKDGDKELRMIRKREMDEVEVLFFDELNRAELKTLNAVFELIQFKSINGERLPKLKTVVAAINPAGDDNYNGTFELDLALRDRFQLYFVTKNIADRKYFVETFDEYVGTALVKWHGENDHNNCYVSPRRLEEIGKAWTKFQNKAVLEAMMPIDNGQPPNVDDLYAELKSAQVRLEGGEIDFSQEIADMDDNNVRSKRTRERLLENLDSMSEEMRANVRDRVATALKDRMSPDQIVNNWLPLVRGFTPAQKELMTEDWDKRKLDKFNFLLTHAMRESTIE